MSLKELKSSRREMSGLSVVEDVASVITFIVTVTTTDESETKGLEVEEEDRI